MMFCKNCGIRVIVGSGYSGGPGMGYRHANCLWEMGAAMKAIQTGEYEELWWPDGDEVKRQCLSDHGEEAIADNGHCRVCFTKRRAAL